MIDKEESIRLHYDWWGNCRTCIYWTSPDRWVVGKCSNKQSTLFEQETWTEGQCEEWDSFDIETALEFLSGVHK